MTTQENGVAGKVVISPGASSGIAEATPRMLPRHGARLVVGARRVERLAALVAIQTDFSGGMVRDNPEINRRVAEMTALGRAGVPDDVGLMIAALLSDEDR